MIEAKKKYGQNFLKDKNFLKKMVDSASLAQKDVFEVGPGMGALTEPASLAARKVIAFEIDKDLKPFLEPLSSKHKNLKIIYQDFLKANLTEIKQEEALRDEIHLLGNLPYYITTPILFKFLETSFLKEATIMMQKEVGERILSKPNQKTYNALSVIMQKQASIKKIATVDKKMFYPVPKVDSIVLQIKKHEEMDPLFKDKFCLFVKTAFLQKRKTMVNNLLTYYKASKLEIATFLQENGFKENVRAEQITVLEFEKIVRKWDYQKNDY